MIVFESLLFLNLVLFSQFEIFLAFENNAEASPELNEMCYGISKAANYCFKIVPMRNAENRQNELNQPYYKNRTITDTTLVRMRLKSIKKELQRTTIELNKTVEVLQLSNKNIELIINNQLRSLELEKDRLGRQNDKEDQRLSLIKNEDNANAVANLKATIDRLQNELLSKNKLLQKCGEQQEKIHKSNVCSNLASSSHNVNIYMPFTIRYNNDIEGGCWIVILHRFNGSVNFSRNWNDFREGFGNPDGEFFIGLENLYLITNSQQYELYVLYQHFDGIKGIAQYDNFRVGNEKSGYALESLGQFSGTSDNIMEPNNLYQQFYTYDKDSNENCVKRFKGAWWFRTCRGPNPFGRYSTYESVSETDSMSWNGWTPIMSIQMLIRIKQ